MTTGYPTAGVVLAIGNGASPEVFQTVNGVLDIPEIGGEKTRVGLTGINDAVEGVIHGRTMLPEVSIVCHYDPDNTGQSAVKTAYTSKTEDNWKITLTDASPATTATFTAKVFSFKISSPDDDSIRLTFILKPTSDLTIA